MMKNIIWSFAWVAFLEVHVGFMWADDPTLEQVMQKQLRLHYMMLFPCAIYKYNMFLNMMMGFYIWDILCILKQNIHYNKLVHHVLTMSMVGTLYGADLITSICTRITILMIGTSLCIKGKKFRHRRLILRSGFVINNIIAPLIAGKWNRPSRYPMICFALFQGYNFCKLDWSDRILENETQK